MANVLYEEASIQAIADALRLKRNGSTDTYTVAEMDDGVLSLPMGNIPSYHRAEAGRVVQKLLELKTLYPNNIIFGTISDNHVDTSTESVMTSARHAVYALEAVGSMTCDFVANLGDNVSGTNIDNDTDYANAVYMENASRYAMTNLTAYNIVGNHCKSNSTQKIYDLIGKYNSFDNYGTTQIRGFGYKDYTNKKVRVICLNTCDYWNITGGNGMSYEQKDFFMKALDLSSKSDYAEWTIIVLSHIPLDFLGGDYNKGADLKAILSAYNNGTSVSIAITSSYASAQSETPSNYETYSSGALVYDYSGKNAPKVVNIHGHIHTNAYGNLTFIDDNTELGIVRVATPNSSFNGNASTDRYTSYGNYSITTTEASKIAKVANSKADTSATFYFFDLNGQMIYAIGYGADIDRTIPYTDATTYTVTYNLTKCESNNTATVVVEGGKYTATITPITDANMDSVIVTMGGADITSTAYADGTITIESVTGDIVITAVASVPLWSETVSDIAVAIRSTWSMPSTSGVPSLANSNANAAIGVTTVNDYAYTDRESNPIYLMPVNAKAVDVTVVNSDGSAVTYCFVGLKSDGSGSFTKVFDTDRQTENTCTWTAGAIDYILIFMQRTDATSYPWGYDDAQVSVTFTNGGTGGGTDEPVNIYTITRNLTNCTDEITDTSIPEGSDLFSSISANSGYVINTVSVTMGGVDISDNVVTMNSDMSSATITIDSVSGDIIITATASAGASYTNLFKSTDADFVDGQILRSSGGTKEGTGFVSGYIEAVSGDTIRVRCPSGTSYMSQSAPIICLYDGSKTFLTGFYSSQSTNVTIDSDNLGFSCTIAKSGTAFVRVQGQPTGIYSDFVVTKNEEIVQSATSNISLTKN